MDEREYFGQQSEGGWELLSRYVYLQISKIIDHYQVSSAYIIGSFLYPDLWMPGISDIDVILLSNNHRYFKDEIIFSPQNIQLGNEKMKVVLSYCVWNEMMFQRSDSWKTYWDQGLAQESSIIEDQLLFNGGNRAIFSKTDSFVDSLQISPTEFRQYITTQYSSVDTSQLMNINLIGEIKKMIYACRIFHYLWTGVYIYSVDMLIVNSVLGDYANNILELAWKIKKDLSKNSIRLNKKHHTYFKDTHRLYSLRKNLVANLLEMDKNKGGELNANFIELY